MPDRGAIAFAIAAGVALMIANATKGPPKGPPDEPPVVGGGPAIPSGSIANVTVAQRPLAGMGSHELAKAPGATITVTVGWMGATRNAAGQAIHWLYKVWAVLETAGTGVGVAQAISPAIIPSVSGETTALMLPIAVSAVAGQLYDVRVYLLAADSDAVGNPTAAYNAIPGATQLHSNAVRVTQTTPVLTPDEPPVVGGGPAIPSGSIANVTVAQRPLASMGSHELAKAPGANISVTVSWAGTTRNAAGQGIAWLYKVWAILETTGTSAAVAQAFTEPILSDHSQQTTTLTMPVAANATPGQLYDVRVYLLGADSDSAGNSIDAYRAFPGATQLHSRAVRVTQATPVLTPVALGSRGRRSPSETYDVIHNQQVWWATMIETRDDEEFQDFINANDSFWGPTTWGFRAVEDRP